MAAADVVVLVQGAVMTGWTYAEKQAAKRQQMTDAPSLWAKARVWWLWRRYQRKAFWHEMRNPALFTPNLGSGETRRRSMRMIYERHDAKGPKPPGMGVKS